MQSVVLLSGGLDCGLNLALAARAGRARLALTFDYGQRAAQAEARAASALARHYGVEWRKIEIPWLGQVNPTGLTRPSQTLPLLATHELDDPEKTQASMQAVWVANRNGVFFNIGAAFAEALGCGAVIAGFNREEAATFPDNSAAYLAALTNGFAFSTRNGVKAESYTTDWDKSRIVAEGLEVNLPFNLLWSCYEAGPERCWRCESCKRSERALLSQGAAGKAWYARMQSGQEAQL